MEFHEYGKRENPTIILMHGMLQNWRSEYTALKPLEQNYRLIVPTMDGMYKDSPDFTCFADQARQIEEFIKENYDGKIRGIYGCSQGGLMISELLARNNIKIDIAVMDGVYVAHQGKLAAYGTFKMMNSVRKKGGKFPKAMDIPMKLMGLGKEDYEMFTNIYWDVSEESMKRNLYENYTYHARPEIKNSDTRVYLWCGSKEPYALKSHKMLKQYLKDYEEHIFEGMGHGQMLLRHSEELCSRLSEVFGR